MKMSQSKFKIIINSFTILEKWLIPRITTTTAHRKQYLEVTAYWRDKIISYLKNHGVQYTCRRMKTVRAITLSYLAGTPVRSVGELIGINAKGLPKDLGPLGALADSTSSMDKRFLLTLLSVTKVLVSIPQPNYESIVAPAKGSIDNEWTHYINRFFRYHKIRKSSLRFDWTEFHLSVKASPSGGLAMSDSLKEISQMGSDLLDCLKILGGKRLGGLIDSLIANLLPKFKEEPVILRRIAAIPDKEGKTRVVALLDYWSQTVLKPLHNKLLDLLRSLPSDMTFNQEAFTSNLMPGPYYSFDLKDATDRFPILLQEKVLSYLIGQTKAKAWTRLLIQEGYKTPEGDHVKYNAGQPMGAYSSWATFALTHHIVVARAAMETQKFPFTQYYLLGDDIVICDSDVAQRYESLMLELGIEFSKTKTFKSKILFEFASRIFLNQEEISPFTVSGVQEASQTPATAIEFIRTMHRHGWELLRADSIPGQILNFMRLGGGPSFARWKPLINVVYSLPKEVVMKGIIPLTGSSLLSQLSCFEHKAPLLLRDAFVLELRERINKSLDEFNDRQFSWAEQRPRYGDIFVESAPGEIPMNPSALPFIGVWNSLKLKGLEASNTLLEYLEDGKEISLDEMVSCLVELVNTPDVIRALKERRHKVITLTVGSLIFKSYNRCLNEGIVIRN